MSGWISLHRKIMEHPFYTEKRKFSRYEAWIDLIMLANHQDNKFMLGNQLIEVKRGSFITSELKLMDKWDWGKEKLRAFLKLLEADGMIIKEATTKQTTITICNYEKHSSKSDRIESSNSNGSEDEADQQQTTGRLLADYEPYTNNKFNNANNENNFTDTIKPPELVLQDEFCRIHEKGDWTLKPSEYQNMQKITAMDIPLDFIINTMTKIHEHKKSKSEKVTSFNFYLDPIVDAWKAKNGGQANGG
ncbi:MAG: repO, partial [Bacilli bacterium]|nr:repO [Bacilli bacterium]